MTELEITPEALFDNLQMHRKLAEEAAAEILRLRAENEMLKAALINLYAAACDLPRTKECRLYNALSDADEVLKEAK